MQSHPSLPRGVLAISLLALTCAVWIWPAQAGDGGSTLAGLHHSACRASAALAEDGALTLRLPGDLPLHLRLHTPHCG